MTREGAMEYRRNAPYDAFGDYSVFETAKSWNGKKVMRMSSPTTGGGFGLLFEMGCG